MSDSANIIRRDTFQELIPNNYYIRSSTFDSDNTIMIIRAINNDKYINIRDNSNNIIYSVKDNSIIYCDKNYYRSYFLANHFIFKELNINKELLVVLFK